MSYRFASLDPRPIEVANEANEKVFASGSVWGIEVTVPVLAAQCEANLDPQHTDGDASLTAIEMALGVELPPDGATLATIRADLDSVGAMVVLSLRAEGIDPVVTEAYERIRLIAESDKFAKGGWPGARPLPVNGNEVDSITMSTESDSRLAPIARAISDFKIPIADRVEVLRNWLSTGEEPEGYREAWFAERKALAEAISDGTIKAELVASGKITLVVSTHRAGTSVGYCLAPVVVALNPEFRFQGGDPHKKFTVCQFETGYVDLKAVFADLNALEDGWGGSPTIGGSPQGMSSELSTDQVVAVVEKHLL